MRRALLSAGIGITALFLTPGSAVAGGGGGCTAQTEGSGATVRMEDFCFTPSVLHVDGPTEVTFVNDDPFDHVVVGTGWQAGEALGPGEEAVHRFDAAGSYPYSCYLHPGMNGVVVVEAGAGAATGAATVPAVIIDALEPAGSSGLGVPAWSLVIVPLAALGSFVLGRRLGPAARS